MCSPYVPKVLMMASINRLVTVDVCEILVCTFLMYTFSWIGVTCCMAVFFPSFPIQREVFPEWKNNLLHC